jgi:hypothetical protein
MKSIKYLFLFAFAVITTVASCDKKQSCAACVEATTGYKPADFCGSDSDVDFYISELISQGGAVGQDWSCTKN